MIIDSFVFNNELEVLEIRLSELYNHVDKFILVEASKTQTRLNKPFYFEENKNRFSRYLDKIVHVKLEDFKSGGEADWSMENFQRESIGVGLDMIHKKDKLSAEDIIMISDVDEVPRGDILDEVFLKVNSGTDVLSLNHYFCSYFLNLFAPSRNWYGTVVSKLDVLQRVPIQYLRSVKDSLFHIENAGWHFSGVGGMSRLLAKYHACIEPFNKKSVPSEEELVKLFQKHVVEDKYFLFCDDPSNRSIKMEILDRQFLPELVNGDDKFKEFLL